MRVKVTPKMPGAGSWEDEVVSKFRTTIDGVEGYAYLLKSRMQVPASICTEIPSITPEPGDIVEGEHGLPFFYDPVKTYSKVVRVLARKPLGAIAAHDAISGFFNALLDNDTQSVEAEAYNAFLQVILGVPYAIVKEDEK